MRARHFSTFVGALLILGLVAVPIAGAGAATPTTYNVVDLGSLGGGATSAAGINVGSVVVGSSDTASGVLHAYSWANGHATDVGALGGSGFGTAVSPNGTVAGFSTTSPTGTSYDGFTWRNGTITDLPPASGLRSNQPAGVNDALQLAETQTAGVGRHTVTHAFFQQGSSATDLGTLGGTQASAAGINADGHVVGTAALASGESHAFSWSAGVMHDLGTLPAGYGSSATSVNDHDQVTGYAGTENFGPTHAFLWSNGTMTDLGVPTGFTRTVGLALNNAGAVVGYTTNAGYSKIHAYVVDAGGARDLNGLIPGNSGWVLSQATGINDGGVVVGNGTHNGDTAAFMLVPATTPTVPAAPVGFTATGGNAKVSLAWQPVANATTYNVKRSTSNAGPFTTIAPGLTATSFVDNAVTNATTYYYVVSARNTAGESPNSNGAAAVPQAPLTAPTQLSARNSARARVALSWVNPPGVAVLQNYVYRSIGTGAFTMIAVLQPSTAYTDTTVSSGRTYRYTVTAVAVVNGAGQESPMATPVSIRTT